jgi:hypothetical protein
VSLRCALCGWLVLLMPLAARPGSAELDAWSGVGPYGGAGWRIEMAPGDPTDPDLVFAASASFYTDRSDDGGGASGRRCSGRGALEHDGRDRPIHLGPGSRGQSVA